MKLVLTIAGILAVWTCIKFVFLVFKRLGSKNSMNDMIARMEDRMAEGAETVAGYIKRTRRNKKRKKKEEPIVTIR